MRGSTRIESLARRVHWLDRYRRFIAITCAMILAPLAVAKLDTALDSDLPGFHAAALFVIVAVGSWCALEVSLAWVAAVWETELSNLLGNRGLPRAIVHTRK